MADDPQYMMNRAKKEIIMATLIAKGGNCIKHENITIHSCFSGTFNDLFIEADKQHCDVLTAALMSLKREKVVSYNGMMLLHPVHKDVVVKLDRPNFDPFAPK
eukprot:TRINITY_DN228_c0_g1_i3.p1 TRINITY_DN228_c0_g1~~TRINITY_DN228_c0_g1_i3.p1  ORF type:complete len:103 (+),score=16.04 TRINITY_DN228_c0_g1_i3:158-466(+)